MGDHSDTDDNGDGEGVWSPDIEQCFREALLLFPPCGRRKHILQEEGGGKMYGRNELIARHIRMRTGKIRSRKQVSSHIQVLARRKAKAESSGGLTGSNVELNATSSSPANLSQVNNSLALNDTRNQLLAPMNSFSDLWADRPIVTTKIRLVEFSAFIEQRRIAQHLNDSSKQIGAPIDELTLGANLNHSQQMNSELMSHGQPGGGLLMPVYESTNQLGAAVPTAATNLSQRHLASPQHLNQASSLQGSTTSAVNSYPSQLQQQPSHSQQLQQPLNNNQQHHQQLNQRNTEANNMMITAGANNLINNHHLHPGPTSNGFTRHSYIKIDYRAPSYRQSNKLERIDIDQLQDKFPEIGGSEGLYRRGPPDAFYLVKFWADINNDFEYNIDDQNSFFGFSCHFETIEPLKNITCSTKACSYGLQVVEKVEKIYAAFNSTNGRYTYNIDRSPMCEFMTRFIKKLRQLPRASQMNSVLENFTVLQVITSESTSEILLCLAFVFEVASGEQKNGSQYHVYKLTKD